MTTKFRKQPHRPSPTKGRSPPRELGSRALFPKNGEKTSRAIVKRIQVRVAGVISDNANLATTSVLPKAHWPEIAGYIESIGCLSLKSDSTVGPVAYFAGPLVKSTPTRHRGYRRRPPAIIDRLDQEIILQHDVTKSSVA